MTKGFDYRDGRIVYDELPEPTPAGDDQHPDAKLRINCAEHGPSYYDNGRAPFETLDDAKAKLANILDKNLCEYEPRIEERIDDCWRPVPLDSAPSNYLTVTMVISQPGRVWDDKAITDLDPDVDTAITLVNACTPHFFRVEAGVPGHAKLAGAEPADWDRAAPIPAAGGHTYDPEPYKVWLNTRENGSGEDGQPADLSDTEHFSRDADGFLGDIHDLLLAAVAEGAMPLPEPIEEVVVNYTADDYENYPDAIKVEMWLCGGLRLSTDDFDAYDLVSNLDDEPVLGAKAGIDAAAEALATIESAIHREIEKFNRYLTATNA